VIFDYLQHLRNQGKAVVICTHRLDEAERFGDRFGLMHHGAMQLVGTLSELRSSTGLRGLTDIFIQLMMSVSAESSA